MHSWVNRAFEMIQNLRRGDYKMLLTDAKRWIERLWTPVQILALLIAALWAYWIFVVKDAPSLEVRTTAGSSLTWRPSNTPGTCNTTFYVEFTNIGISSVEIRRVRIRGWRFTEPEDNEEFAQYVDMSDVQKSDTFFDRWFEEGPFIRPYPRAIDFIILMNG